MEEIRHPFYVTFQENSAIVLNATTLEAVDLTPADFLAWKEGAGSPDLDRFLSQDHRTISSGMPNKGDLKIILNQYCNLDCKYCYELKKAPIVIKPEIVAEHLKKNSYRNVTLFGGEPLLYFDTFKAVAGIVKENGIKNIFTTTNGTLITNSVAKFLCDMGVRTAVSIDGRENVHNTMRIDKAGVGTYERVVSGIRKLQDYGIRVTAGITISLHNAKTIEEEIEHLVTALNIDNFAFSLYLGDNPAYENLPSDVLVRAYEKLLELGVREETLSYMIKTLYTRKPMTKGCAIGFGAKTLMPNGNLYGCHVAAMLGLERPTIQDYVNRTLDKIPECNRCYAAAICGGGCTFAAYMNRGIFSPGGNCDIMRATMEWAVRKFYA